MVILLLILSFLLPFSANAATYWVSKSASSQNCVNSATDPGAASSSLTIAQGLACMSGGDTLVIKAGTYTEFINQAAILSGISNNQRTIIRANTGDLVTLTGIDTGSGLNGQIWVNGKSFVTFDGLTLDGGTTGGYLVYVYPNGSTQNSFITFKNMEIKNGLHADGSSCFVIVGNNIQVIDNKVHDCDGFGSPLGAHGIYVAGNPTGVNFNNLIERNEVYNIGLGSGGPESYCIHEFHGVPNPNNSLVVRWNYVHDCQNGIIIGSGTGNEAYGNIVVGPGSSGGYGIQIAYEGSNLNKVFNNVIYNTGFCMVMASTANDTIRNNLCMNNVQNSIVDNGGVSGLSASNNSFVTDDGSYVISAATRRFSPKESSTLIDAGSASGLPVSLTSLGSQIDGGPFEAPIFFSAVVQNATPNQVDLTFSVSTQGVQGGIGLQNCIASDFVVTVAAVSRTSLNCTVNGTGTANVTFGGAAVTAGQAVTIAYNRGGLTDNICIGGLFNCKNAEIRTFGAQTVVNNVSGGGGMVWSTIHFRCFNWYGNLSSPTWFPVGIPEDSNCTVMFGGKLAIAVGIDCTGTNCDPTTFIWKWNRNGGAKTLLTDIATSNKVAFFNPAPSVSDGQVITSTITTNPHSLFLNGVVIGKQSTQPTVDLALNQATQVLLLLQTDATAIVGDQYCFYPERPGDVAITYTKTPCFTVVNPGSTPF